MDVAMVPFFSVFVFVKFVWNLIELNWREKDLDDLSPEQRVSTIQLYEQWK
jgi:hypothetical protein